jgi:hypothetical protein
VRQCINMVWQQPRCRSTLLVRTGAHMIYDGSDPYSYKAQLPLVLLSISNYLQDVGASIRLTTLLRDLAARELGGSTYGSHKI